MIKAVLFDLDGTFADTAPDLAAALNQVLKEEGKAPLALDIIRPVVSHGGIALIRLGFNFDEQHTDFERLRLRLLEIYLNNISHFTTVFEGIDELLAKLEDNNIVWGIVTNKPGWLTDPLMEQMGYTKRAATIISGDTTKQRKPHPEPLFYACQQINCHPSECLYIGDAERDIIAGNAAGMTTITALFGYIEANDSPEHWGADAMINHPAEIENFL
ncbi:MAG: HAD-IA family hydrolase [gamma proteobacterium symbiont of Bathyaustriella thionipta]|nr:HAD-IA family hydrolase [gamma proteobacterium symbiont of Bathyaustriella thionipta]MCU7949545.1 HAD-IA family hydrolase [gamma proteobacterium symbiont of Bathyaustriella thionipta]MCU7952327.1 HAD-IA family hydrolase [gamma proteobacterium symbiont of Bathyaustriella thionipta]MCU7956145.1 HAD-IA family hydrolase [gamma proteobacterium symbiont of Bathyaustriella thionipta]MCU7967154.1 HAD-IA family hydrolase [gamma proteobacterium symbiont of Bathyaustriella thionipta]